MTEYYIDPEDIVSDFLRSRLTDPRTRAEATDTDNVVATSGQTSITLSPPSGKVSCITSVTVNAVTKTKWLDYYWDYQNEKITFYTPLTLSDAVVINFKYSTTSTNWIYSDFPADNLSTTSFPRISVFTVASSGNRMGQYTAPVESSHILQIDVWVKDKYTYTVNSRTYSGEYLARYLANQITKAFEQYESDLFPLLYNYRIVSGPRTAPYSDEYQAFHSIVEVNLKGLRTGRIEV